MAVEGLTQTSKGYPIQRQFLYADYSPFEDNMNVIEMLKDFVSLTGRLIRIHLDNEKMASLLNTADAVRQDVIFVVKQASQNSANALDLFHKKYPDALATELHASSAALLNDAKKTISAILSNTRIGFDEQHRKYKDGIISRINDNHAAAAALLQKWLSNDYKNFPTSLFSNLTVEMSVSVDTVNSKAYTVYRSSSSIKQAARNAGQNKGWSSMPFNYMFRIDTFGLEFWGSIRRISEFGLKEVALPIGLRRPISEKLKNAFKVGSRKDSFPAKEPEFVKVDDYCILSIKWDPKTLLVQLVPDVAKSDIDCIEITYDISDLASFGSRQLNHKIHATKNYPRISYKSRKNGHSIEFRDALRVKEIAQASDLTKILTLGTAILEKMKILQDPRIVSSGGKLELLKGRDNHVLLQDGTTKVEFTLLFELLNLIASSFAPIVKRLKEKTPVRGELILREEIEKGQRKEFTIRLDDLRSQLLSSHYCGSTITDTLQL